MTSRLTSRLGSRLPSGRGRQHVRWLRRAAAGTTTAGLVLVAVPFLVTVGPTAPTTSASPAASPAASPVAAGSDLMLVASSKPLRKLKRYRVRPGDTPASVAVRYHAWTAELVARNGRILYVGDVIRIPVVRSAQRACRVHSHHRTHVDRHKGPKSPKPRTPKPRTHERGHQVRHLTGWHHTLASRPRVRRVIEIRARRHGVNPDLALAIAWQESGWQQRRVSSAGALGAMQIMPGTGRWISQVLGRRLNPRDLLHNAVTGVSLIRILRDEARPKVAVAGYYQGLAGVRRHGMYPSTKAYVANVMALKRRIARGWLPY